MALYCSELNWRSQILIGATFSSTYSVEYVIIWYLAVLGEGELPPLNL